MNDTYVNRVMQMKSIVILLHLGIQKDVNIQTG